MWALFAARLRTWILLTVALPLGATPARALARRIESRNGETKISRTLYTASDLVSQRQRQEHAASPPGAPRRARARQPGVGNGPADHGHHDDQRAPILTAAPGARPPAERLRQVAYFEKLTTWAPFVDLVC
jgi:hypothetical protein